MNTSNETAAQLNSSISVLAENFGGSSISPSEAAAFLNSKDPAAHSLMIEGLSRIDSSDLVMADNALFDEVLQYLDAGQRAVNPEAKEELDAASLAPVLNEHPVASDASPADEVPASSVAAAEVEADPQPSPAEEQGRVEGPGISEDRAPDDSPNYGWDEYESYALSEGQASSDSAPPLNEERAQELGADSALQENIPAGEEIPDPLASLKVEGTTSQRSLDRLEATYQKVTGDGLDASTVDRLAVRLDYDVKRILGDIKADYLDQGKTSIPLYALNEITETYNPKKNHTFSGYLEYLNDTFDAKSYDVPLAKVFEFTKSYDAEASEYITNKRQTERVEQDSERSERLKGQDKPQEGNNPTVGEKEPPQSPPAQVGQSSGPGSDVLGAGKIAEAAVELTKATGRGLKDIGSGAVGVTRNAAQAGVGLAGAASSRAFKELRRITQSQEQPGAGPAAIQSLSAATEEGPSQQKSVKAIRAFSRSLDAAEVHLNSARKKQASGQDATPDMIKARKEISKAGNELLNVDKGALKNIPGPALRNLEASGKRLQEMNKAVSKDMSSAGSRNPHLAKIAEMAKELSEKLMELLRSLGRMLGRGQSSPSRG